MRHNIFNTEDRIIPMLCNVMRLIKQCHENCQFQVCTVKRIQVQLSPSALRENVFMTSPVWVLVANNFYLDLVLMVRIWFRMMMSLSYLALSIQLIKDETVKNILLSGKIKTRY